MARRYPNRKGPWKDWYIYALKLGWGHWYIDITHNVERTVKEHKEGVKGKISRFYGVRKLAWSQRIPDHYQATAREYKTLIIIKACKKYGPQWVHGGKPYAKGLKTYWIKVKEGYKSLPISNLTNR